MGPHGLFLIWIFVAALPFWALEEWVTGQTAWLLLPYFALVAAGVWLWETLARRAEEKYDDEDW